MAGAEAGRTGVSWELAKRGGGSRNADRTNISFGLIDVTAVTAVLPHVTGRTANKDAGGDRCYRISAQIFSAAARGAISTHGAPHGSPGQAGQAQQPAISRNRPNH
jgi:hypothetical protein